MLDFLSIIPVAFASHSDVALTSGVVISTKGLISILGLVSLFLILATEKIDKTLVSILIAGLLIFFQVFSGGDGLASSSQEVASAFIYNNLDIFGFIIGMMIISGLVKDSGIFNYLAITIVKATGGNPKKLFFIFVYLAFVMTIFISNIPTIIILAPLVILISKKLDLPSIPFIIGIITFANLGGAVTPISDPTTYYQATTLGFRFLDVVGNTGLIMICATFVSSAYLYMVFRKDLAIKPEMKEIEKMNPKDSLGSFSEIFISLFILFFVVGLVVFKEYIFNNTGIRFDNGSIALFGAFLAILLLRDDVSTILKTKVDYATLFFFAGLFVVVGSLEHNGVIVYVSDMLLRAAEGNEALLLLMVTTGSATLSVFIDNVPYNIAMVSTLEQFRDTGIFSYTVWKSLAYGLNACTSIGGAGSPIGAACNVIALGLADKNGIIIKFLKYLMIGIPLVLINSLVAYLILFFRYLG